MGEIPSLWVKFSHSGCLWTPRKSLWVLVYTSEVVMGARVHLGSLYGCSWTPRESLWVLVYTSEVVIGARVHLRSCQLTTIDVATAAYLRPVRITKWYRRLSINNHWRWDRSVNRLADGKSSINIDWERQQTTSTTVSSSTDWFIRNCTQGYGDSNNCTQKTAWWGLAGKVPPRNKISTWLALWNKSIITASLRGLIAKSVTQHNSNAARSPLVSHSDNNGKLR